MYGLARTAVENQQGTLPVDGHMLVARCDVDVPGTDNIAGRSLLDGQHAFGVEPFGQQPGEHRRDMLDDDDARQRRPQLREDGRQGLGSPCGGADGNQLDLSVGKGGRRRRHWCRLRRWLCSRRLRGSWLCRRGWWQWRGRRRGLCLGVHRLLGSWR